MSVRLSLPYGGESLVLDGWPWRLEVLEPPACSAPGDAESDALQAGLRAARTALDAAGPEGGGRIAVAVPDGTRPAWARAPLAGLLRGLAQAGIDPARIDVLVARGLHRGGPPADLEGLPVAVRLHDAFARDLVAHPGPDGVPLAVNRHWAEAASRIALGAAGFHYLAGFGGGRKVVVPGLAGSETVAAVHRRALDETGSRRRGVAPGRLDGNPFHETLEACVAVVPPTVAVESVATAAGPRHWVGDWREVHRRGASWVLRARAVAVAEPRPLVVASAGGHPRDRDLIQSHKALEHLRGALRSGGTVVLVASCGDGSGHPDLMAYLSRGGARDIASALQERFAVYGQTAWALREKAESMRIVLVSRLPARETLRAGLVPASGLADALERARESVPARAEGWILPDAASCLALGAR